MLRLIALLTALASPALAQNTATILHEGYDRFPKVNSTVTQVRTGEVLNVADPGMAAP